MNRLQTGVPRRTVIEAWLKYDAAKKRCALPDFSTWPWESADGLDEQLKGYGFKHGIIAGYLSWTLNALTLDDLRECAVVNQPIPGHPRCLGQLEGTPELEAWRPDRPTSWYEPLSACGVLQQDAPLVLRPSVRSELPARWYLEDGSGRALAIIQTARNRTVGQIVAYAYIADSPDDASTFMQCQFADLLQLGGRGLE
jgi:hypothetical protein